MEETGMNYLWSARKRNALVTITGKHLIWRTN